MPRFAISPLGRSTTHTVTPRPEASYDPLGVRRMGESMARLFWYIAQNKFPSNITKESLPIEYIITGHRTIATFTSDFDGLGFQAPLVETTAHMCQLSVAWAIQQAGIEIFRFLNLVDG